VTDRPPHPLKLWLKAHGHSQSWLARQIGASSAQVSNWMRDKNGPRPAFAIKIEELTDGAVTARQLHIRANPRLVRWMEARDCLTQP